MSWQSKESNLALNTFLVSRIGTFQNIHIYLQLFLALWITTVTLFPCLQRLLNLRMLWKTRTLPSFETLLVNLVLKYYGTLSLLTLLSNSSSLIWRQESKKRALDLELALCWHKNIVMAGMVLVTSHAHCLHLRRMTQFKKNCLPWSML